MQEAGLEDENTLHNIHPSRRERETKENTHTNLQFDFIRVDYAEAGRENQLIVINQLIEF